MSLWCDAADIWLPSAGFHPVACFPGPVEAGSLDLLRFPVDPFGIPETISPKNR
jgi:hypothetical protein